MSVKVIGCLACNSDKRPPPEINFGAFTIHILAIVGNVDYDDIVSKLCPWHRRLYDDMITVGEAHIRKHGR
jgi:hypothetical protein